MSENNTFGLTGVEVVQGAAQKEPDQTQQKNEAVTPTKQTEKAAIPK